MIFYYVIIFMIPFENHPILSTTFFGMSPIRLIGALAFLHAFIKILNNDFRFMARRNTIVPFIMFVTIYLLSSFINGVSITERYGIRFLSATILFFITLILVDNQKIFCRSLVVLIVSMSISSSYAIKQFIIKYHIYGINVRPAGTFIDSNYYAVAAAVVAALALVAGMEKYKYKIFYLLNAGVITTGLILSQSRGGFLAFLSALFCNWWKSKNKMFGPLLIIGAVFALVSFLPNNLINRFQNQDVGSQKSIEHRLLIIDIGIEMFMKNPLLGIGPGMFKIEAAKHLDEDAQARIAHNSYLEVMTELGVLGITSLLWFWFATVRELNKKVSDLNKDEPDQTLFIFFVKALFVATLGYFVGALFLSVEYDKLMWLCLSLGAVSRQIPPQQQFIKAEI